MLSAIEIRGFRCFGPRMQQIPLAPLTILTGVNGSGKSTLLTAIRSFAAPVPLETGRSADLLFPGFNIDPRVPVDPRDFHRQDGAGESHLALTQRLAMGPSGSSSEGTRSEVARALAKGVSWSLDVCARAPRRVVHSLHDRHRASYGCLVLEMGDRVEPAQPQCTLRFGKRTSFPCLPAWGWDRATLVDDGTFEVEIPEPDLERTKAGFGVGAAKGMARLALELSQASCRGFREIRFLSSSRGDLRDAPMIQAPESVGSHGEFILQRLAGADRIKNRSGWDAIQRWLAYFGATEVTTVVSRLNLLSGRFKDAPTGVSVEAALGSSGLRQVLPLIVEVFLAPRGATLLVEEPELSVHPRSQQAIADMLVEAVSQGKQVIASTHSETLVAALHAPLRSGHLRRAQLRTYEVSRNERGASVVRRFDVQARGGRPDWPESWRSSEQSLTERYE